MGVWAILFSFKGSIGRAPYAWVAIPILIIFQLQPLWSEWLFGRLKLPLTSIWVMSLVLMLMQLLRFPLLAASVKRLHDLKRSGWWAAPYLAPWALTLFDVAAPSLMLTYGNDAHGWEASRKITNTIATGFWIYGLVLALLLLVIPSRKAGPEAAF